MRVRIFFLFCLCVLLSCCKSKQKTAGSKLRICPDEWIENRMPGTQSGSTKNNQYFIINHERREIRDFDLDWIRNNCDIKEPQIVY